jgi:hypothetical protein
VVQRGGNVGIGTTSPGTKLQVNSTAGTYGITNTNGTVTIGTYIEASNTYASFGTSSNHPIGFFTNNNAPQMYINTSGNVGIGTTSPSEKLEIYGSAAATSNFTALKLTNGSDGGLKILFSNAVSSELASIIAGVSSAGAGTDDGTLIFSTATNAVSAERMRITSGGLVGIGTSSPSYLLDVNGTGSFTNTSGETLILSKPTGPSIQFNKTATTAQGWQLSGEETAFKLFNTTTSTVPFQLATSGAATFTGNVTIQKITSGLILNGTPFGNSGAYVNFQGWANTNKNWQIGVANIGPAGLLFSPSTTAGGTTFSSGVIAFSEAGSISLDGTLTAGGNVRSVRVFTNSGGNSTDPIIAPHDDTNNGIFFPSADTFAITTAGSERMRITSGGIVLIGGTNTYYGNLVLKSNSATTYYGLNVVANGNTNFIALNHTGTVGVIETEHSGGSFTDMTFRTGGAERMRITSAGEVWMGYTSDQGAYLLQVNGAVFASSYFESSDTRLKNITNTHNGLDFGAIQYTWKDGRDAKLHWGYAAQDVMKYIPDAVNENKDGFLSLDYNQAHTYKIAMLEKRITELEQQLKNK